MGLFSGKTTTQTSTTTLPGREGAESSLLQLLQRLASQSAGQLGNLGALAGGQVGGPSGADQELIQQSIMRAAQMAQSQLGMQGNLLGAQGREQLSSRGVSGSSSEVLQTLLNQLGTQQGINQSILGAQQQGGEALMQLPFQRAQVQLSANQQLFSNILNAGGGALNVLSAERMAQPTTTNTTKSSGFGLSDLVQLGQLATSFSLPGLLNGGPQLSGTEQMSGMKATNSIMGMAGGLPMIGL